MALDVRVWNLSCFVALSACHAAVIPGGQHDGEGDGNNSGDTASSSASSAPGTETGNEPECRTSQDCYPEWGCYEGRCEYHACPTDGGGCNDNDDGYGDDTYGGCGSDDDCNEGEYCSDGQCISGPTLPECAEQLEITALQIPVTDPIDIALLDGGPDAYATLVFTDGTGLAVATSDGASTMHPTPEVIEPLLLAAADYDGDGREDVALRGLDELGQDIVATYAVADGGITWLGTTIVARWPMVADADLDGDGRIDLAIWRQGDGNDIMRGLGDGTFDVPTPLAFSAYPIAGGQLDDDGHAELMTDDRNVWFRSEDAMLAHSLALSTAHPELEAVEAVVVDLDLDGTRELVVGSGTSPSVIEHVDASGDLLASFLVTDGSFLHGVANIMGGGPRDLVLHNAIVTGLPEAPCAITFGDGFSVATGNFDGDERDELVFAAGFTYELYVVRYAGP